MNYKLIAMDFDGTLLTNDKKVTRRTRKVLQDYKELGYIIVGVTARNLGGVRDECDFQMFDYLILNNGVFIYDVAKSKGDFVADISKIDAKQLTREVEGDALQIDYCSGTKYYIYKNRVENPPSFIQNIKDINEIDEKIARMNLFFRTKELTLHYYNFIREKYHNFNCFVMQDSNDKKRWLVVNPLNIDKAATLKELGKRLGICEKEMIFFGDGLNDLVMMQDDFYSVAMGNALDEVKEKACAVTLTNEEDGIAIFLEKLLKISDN